MPPTVQQFVLRTSAVLGWTLAFTLAVYSNLQHAG
jgi:hypothetical protein